ncbi:MAG: hypothetical protein HY539_01730 [Deltaproteobacteria bacterium]|nr:hypothetical protein [Deltaproteobacteria bacterium]
MNLFDRNRNELSRYFYDVSKAVLISYIAIPILQGSFQGKLVLVGVAGTVLALTLGMALKKGKQ